MTTSMRYDDDLGNPDYKNWIVSEETFDSRFLGKGEAVLSLGNGYMGIRSATEERYVGETRNLFVAGTFNKFADNEVTELPNAADVLWMEFSLNGESFHLKDGKIHAYHRYLNLKDAQLVRRIKWESPKGALFELVFLRFVSLDDRHTIVSRVVITPLSGAAEITLVSGINGQMTNSGVQHFEEGERRFYDKKYMQLLQKTTESGIDFIFSSVHTFKLAGTSIDAPGAHIEMDRRQILMNYHPTTVKQGESFTVSKFSSVFTSRDNDLPFAYSLEKLKTHALTHIKKISEIGHCNLLALHKKAWQERVWEVAPIAIDSANAYDQLAIRFAQYHLTVMTPAHDNRMNIGAKGLSGEGYKGHTFWDTEIFILPYFIYQMPDVARSLLEYRYHTLGGAHKKARENGYMGAQFPWESAWMDDGEVTPVWGAADIVTGKSTKIWSGFIEQHITSDIAFATWQYFQITGDQDFMDQYGYELLMDTAKFWASRLEWCEGAGQYHINHVIGPDEYKEHVDNNAFTNHTAHWNIKKAMAYYVELSVERPELFARLDEKLDLVSTYAMWEERVDKIYLPQPREEDLVIPQDDTYLSLEVIDLTKYKNQENVGSMFKDYNLDQVGQIQVSKQTDTLLLFYLLEDLFDAATKRANWDYYEPKTLHDSSLSLSTHSVLASDMGDEDMAYALFRRATEIDLGPNMKTSDAGIHSASLGGIWQCIVNGFGGVRMLNGQLRIEPKLPAAWRSLHFRLNWHGDLLAVTVRGDAFTVERLSAVNESIEILHKGELHSVVDSL
ncbi:MAG: hypothetical protein FWE07_07940, partial [Turicibacter sp.]|nr:hypothetical protein [Turicibacter sp.]